MNSRHTNPAALPDYPALLAHGRRLRSQAVHAMLQRLFGRWETRQQAIAPGRADRVSVTDCANPSCA
ncbi:MAG: hypothetical protein R3E68_08550 [Burkholderiaceae bacterium]